jgi:hypothetical protein
VKTVAISLLLIGGALAAEREVPRLARQLENSAAGDRAAARLAQIGTDEALTALIMGIERCWYGHTPFDGHGQQWMGPIVGKLVPFFLRHPSGDQDRIGYVRLAAYSLSSALPLLLRDLHSKNEGTAQFAAVWLWRFPEAFAHVSAALCEDPRPLVKEGAIEALGRMGNPHAIPLLEQVLSQPDVEASKAHGWDNPDIHLTCMMGGHCHSLHDAANEALEQLR